MLRYASISDRHKHMRFCKRCKKIFKTAAKRGRICSKCRKPTHAKKVE